VSLFGAGGLEIYLGCGFADVEIVIGAHAADDTELYARGQSFLDREKDIVGSVLGYVPFVGYVTILLSEYPWLKTAMLGFMALTVVLQRE
jgi:signal peptidase